ncbi:MAG: pentapeptide repeat-containing protein [Planctomycetota bacterium]
MGCFPGCGGSKLRHSKLRHSKLRHSKLRHSKLRHSKLRQWESEQNVAACGSVRSSPV